MKFRMVTVSMLCVLGPIGLAGASTSISSYRYCEITNNGVAFHVPVVMRYPNAEKSYEMLVYVYCERSECGGSRVDLYSIRETGAIFPNAVAPMLGLKLNKRTATSAELSWGLSKFVLDTAAGELVWTHADGRGIARCEKVAAL